MPTLGCGPRHPPGIPSTDGGYGQGIKHSKPRGGGFYNSEYPSAPLGGYFLKARGMTSLKLIHADFLCLKRKLQSL